MKKIFLVFVFLCVYTQAYSQDCVNFVKWHLGIASGVNVTGTGSAKDAGAYLLANGFKQVSNPQWGDIAVFQPTNSSIKNDPLAAIHGHIGIVGGWSDNNKFNCIGSSQISKGKPLGTVHQDFTKRYGKTITEWAVSRGGVTFFRKG